MKRLPNEVYENAPEGATHYSRITSKYFKVEGTSKLMWSVGGIWVNSLRPMSDFTGGDLNMYRLKTLEEIMDEYIGENS